MQMLISSPWDNIFNRPKNIYLLNDSLLLKNSKNMKNLPKAWASVMWKAGRWYDLLIMPKNIFTNFYDAGKEKIRGIDSVQFPVIFLLLYCSNSPFKLKI